MLNCAHVDRHAKGAASPGTSFARYAIYYTPQPGTALAAFGRSWFGRAAGTAGGSIRGLFADAFATPVIEVRGP